MQPTTTRAFVDIAAFQPIPLEALRYAARAKVKAGPGEDADVGDSAEVACSGVTAHLPDYIVRAIRAASGIDKQKTEQNHE